MTTSVSAIVGGKVFNGADFEAGELQIADGQFVGDVTAADDGEVVDATGCYVIPGLVDLHFHGSAGADISDGDLEGLHKMGAYEASRGITAMCPATMTLPEDVLTKAAEAAAAYVPAANEADLVGINMEGPFISPDKVGAQNPEFVRNPSVEEFRRLQKVGNGLFKLVDIAPEEPGADDFIEQLGDEVRISVAHTSCDYETAAHAFEEGARHLTHCYNAMPSMHHRKPGPIPAAVENGDVTAEIIADGVHIHPAMVRLAFHMFGDDHMILVSDTLRAAGLGDGVYDLGGQDVTVKGYEARIDNGALAGSVSDLMRCLYVAVTEMGIPLASAVKAASANPARALGLSEKYGSLEPGHVADAVLLDEQTLELKGVILRGQLL
ncbi:MAG: N-acetylglucosamine-6-phosphate deacetylase [Eggerthellaceae bacterium]|nr:N-acetylglucosamine-6-phosphate deacetylase [Eggerthellaceae bacterium]